ncbi:MAG: ORF6N domain-containing protein [Nitrospirae bacterium]|nr:ORF6N domain-containing protein [Nitrospirota bacterium]
MDIVKLGEIEGKILELRGQKVILDSDVAEFYGVETRDINKAVKNNPDKFPEGYIFELNKAELEDLRWKISTAKFSKTRVLPKAFAEKGLYMLATILKSPQATQTTIAIIETFAKIRNLSRNIKALSNAQDDSQKRNLLKKSGEIIAEILDDNLVSNERETTIELNFAVLKFKHTIKKTTKNEKK